MSRSERLLDLLQVLRRHRRPVTGAVLAAETGISIRTLYRDIATLQGQGAQIEGEPGLGYVLRPGFLLPPLMLAEEEIEALLLGSRWVASRGDARLASAAQNALAKISAVLPGDLRGTLDQSALLVGTGPQVLRDTVDLAELRRAIRAERKVEIAYADGKGVASSRVIWPIGLGFFDLVRVVVAWCELRCDLRHFRTDRMASLIVSETRYPRRRAVLLKEWHAAEKIASGQNEG
jgi:predicted DNA-binding transcriptional regulator YafY